MGIVVKAFGKEHCYELKEEKGLPPKERTKWFYKTPSLQAQMDAKEDMEIESVPGATPEDFKQTIRMKLSDARAVNIIRSCLVRVENLKDEDGTAVVWTSSMSRDKQDEFLAVISPWRAELAGAFEKAQVITEEEGKNSK